MLARLKKFVYGDRSSEDTWWLKKVNRSGLFTPDLWELNQYKSHLVVVYGNEQQGHDKHFRLLDGATYHGQAYTLNPRFMMWKKSIGSESYPFALEGMPKSSRITVNPGRIVGEMYSVTTKQLIKLDDHVLNTVQFDRVRVNFVIPRIETSCWLRAGSPKPALFDRKCIGPKIEAWFYLGKNSFWEDLLDGGYRYPMVTDYVNNKDFPTLKNSFHYSVSEHGFKTTQT